MSTWLLFKHRFEKIVKLSFKQMGVMVKPEGKPLQRFQKQGLKHSNFIEELSKTVHKPSGLNSMRSWWWKPFLKLTDEKQRRGFVGLWWIWPPVILVVPLSQAPAEPSITVCRHFGVGGRKRRRRLSRLLAAVVPPSQCGRALVSEMRASPQRGAGRCWTEARHHRYNCCCWTSRL